MANIWENSVITNKGLALQAKMMVGGAINISSVKSGAGTVDVSKLAEQTEVTNIKQTLAVQQIRTGDDEYTAIVPVLLSNNGLSTAYNLYQVGFYAEDPDEGEILYAIAQSSVAKPIPSATETPGYSLMWNFHFSLSNEINMTFTVNPAGLVTFEAVDAAVQKSNANKADKVDTVIEGTFSQNRKAGTDEGAYSHTTGKDNEASGDYSSGEGLGTVALTNQKAIGHYNDDSKSTANSESGTSSGTAFVIGNGTKSVKSNAFRVTGTGQVVGKSAYSASGADYAEFFEWKDGNPGKEDRVGHFVTFADGRFIKKAEEGDYILGIVSGNPCVLGNHDECWMGQNEMDEWGRFIYETVKEINPETGEEKEAVFYKVNPEYDSTKEYIPRQERPEWSAVGMFGVLHVRDDGTCQVNGYCKCTAGGIATTCERGIDTYRVIERVTDNIVKVVLK